MRHFVIFLIFSININVMAQIAFKEKLQYNSVQNASHSYDSLENIRKITKCLIKFKFIYTLKVFS